MNKEIPKIYDPKLVEDKIYKLWEESGYFNPDKIESKERYCNILPPPNANGELHLGHASGYTVMDILGRFERMRGKKVLLLPGKDHAGILSQVVYEQKIKKERGMTRQDLGREKFYQEVYDFCEDMSGYMREQEKKIGISADWSREKFTLDSKISETVLDTFVKMYNEGLIYKGKRIISWCPRCGSALSDLEVEHREREGHLYYINYPLENSKEFITVATTRPETMLGDTAVAVNPKDGRYKKLVGKNAVLPLLNRIIPIIADRRVDEKFGTGAVKITPAHDPLDWEIGKDHGLPEIQVIDEKANITPLGEKYEGLGVREARVEIIKDLEKLNLLQKTETVKHSISECERCKATIEPLISDQWFVSVDHPKISLKKMALEAIRDGEIKIYPKSFEKILTQWLENLRDWCISRQIWWGHRFPVYYKEKSKIDREIYVGINPPERKGWVQDENTFDTWFSSGQWTYATLDYPDGKDYKEFYPTDTMIMGRDILFFWSARMIMMSLYRTGKSPFKKLFFTGLVRDKLGKKMSKSRGNGIDPLEMVKKYGADALRLSLIINTTPGLDFRLYEEKIESFRNFTNKLWNISRFVLMNVSPKTLSNGEINLKNLNRESMWILQRHNETIRETSQNLERLNFSMAGEILRDFTWNTFADWYLEFTKVDKNENVEKVLVYVLKNILKLWHPFMPFVTESIWSNINKEKLLMVEKWPQGLEIPADQSTSLGNACHDIEKTIEIITRIRNLKSDYNIPVNQKIDITIASNKEWLEDFNRHIMKLAGTNEPQYLPESSPQPAGCVAGVVPDIGTICLNLEKLVDADKEKQKAQKELDNIQKFITSLSEKMIDKQFLEKAPGDVILKQRDSLKKAKEKEKQTKSFLQSIA